MKWVFTINTIVDRTIKQFKVRLVARRFSQAYRLDYDEIFTLIVRIDMLQLFLAIVAFEDLEY
jgi:hypothetical protein